MSERLGREQILAALTEFIVTRVLDGADDGIDADTPLLELGIVDSMTVVALIGFCEQRFSVAVPADAVVAANFRNLGALTALIRKLQTPT